MSVLDDFNFPSMEEFFERYGDDGVQEPRNEYYMLHEQYEETYAAQFSYEFVLIKDTKLRNVSETPINYDVSEYYFDPQLGLGIHKEIGLVVVFHRDPRKNYIIRSLLYERYAQAIMCKMSLFRGALQLLRAKDELSLKLVLNCDMGEPGLEHARGKLSPQCMPLQAVPIHFGFGCDCGIIRRKYGELSRHSCIQRDSIRPVVFKSSRRGLASGLPTLRFIVPPTTAMRRLYAAFAICRFPLSTKIIQPVFKLKFEDQNIGDEWGQKIKKSYMLCIQSFLS
ncbi:unnamed protein product [Debaryomyces fabryi]|nr:unnamed protein product [Debaryomyces fabryi]